MCKRSVELTSRHVEENLNVFFVDYPDGMLQDSVEGVPLAFRQNTVKSDDD